MTDITDFVLDEETKQWSSVSRPIGPGDPTEMVNFNILRISSPTDEMMAYAREHGVRVYGEGETVHRGTILGQTSPLDMQSSIKTCRKYFVQGDLDDVVLVRLRFGF